MLFRTHAIIGIFAGLVVVSWTGDPLSFFICLFASLLPDIDSTKSFIGRRFYFRPIQWIVKHRGFFHSLTACILFSLIIARIAPSISFAFFVGYAAHLLADSFTVEGVTPFWPLAHKTEGTMTTGNLSENFIFFSFCVLSLLVLLRLYFNSV